MHLCREDSTRTSCHGHFATRRVIVSPAIHWGADHDVQRSRIAAVGTEYYMSLFHESKFLVHGYVSGVAAFEITWFAAFCVELKEGNKSASDVRWSQ